MERKNIMLSFKGELTVELLNAILHAIELKMESIEENSSVRRKVFNILVECLQNLFHHNEITSLGERLDGQQPSGIVMVAKNGEGYSVITGNFVSSEDAASLESKLKTVNRLGREELKGLYKKVLATGEFSAKGGGGLGIIDIARKSGEPLQYGFVPFNKVSQFFSLNVIVNS